jgi:hypothetical protein
MDLVHVASSDSVSQLASQAPASTDGRAVAICIHHSGRCFRTTFDLASAFVRRVHVLVDHGRGELVPLLHQGGLDILYVSAQTPLQVHDVRDHSLDSSHPRTAV